MTELYEFVQYLAEHPTVADILMVVHKVEVKKKRWDPKKKREIENAMREFGMMTGMEAQTPDPDIKESIDFAAELMRKMKIQPN